MLTKTINVSGVITTQNGVNVNVNFNYRSSVNELTQIDFNFNKNEVNVYGSYSCPMQKVMNYSVNNGIIESEDIEDVIARIEQLAADPENEDLYSAEF